MSGTMSQHEIDDWIAQVEAQTPTTEDVMVGIARWQRINPLERKFTVYGLDNQVVVSIYSKSGIYNATVTFEQPEDAEAVIDKLDRALMVAADYPHASTEIRFSGMKEAS